MTHSIVTALISESFIALSFSDFVVDILCDLMGESWEVSGFCAWLFYVSKYYEFFDTIQIVGRRRRVIFLQYYHHAGSTVPLHMCAFIIRRARTPRSLPISSPQISSAPIRQRRTKIVTFYSEVLREVCSFTELRHKVGYEVLGHRRKKPLLGDTSGI